MSFSPFHYWRRGVQMTKPLTTTPARSVGSLVLHQIAHGDYDPCPYWDMSMEEISMWQSEVDEYRDKGFSKEAVTEFSQTRWIVYKKRINKLQEAHVEYEQNRILMLRKGLIAAFNLDLWDEALEACEGDDAMAIYNTYLELAQREIHQDDSPY